MSILLDNENALGMLRILKRKRKLNFRQIFRVQNRLNYSHMILIFGPIFYGILKQGVPIHF